MPKSKHIIPCARCGRRVWQSDDRVRVIRMGVTLYEHWSCFIRQLREQDQRSAEAVAEVVR